ncbi:hypothetical protein AMTR_s00167p00076730 [Amborella trichopoda]|uniref:Uncharacterized protein n=1 Tax=Amborella trichopoda TaxID=13333 RepID=W1PUC3_AMBTC|nr:hypothetical protein AMTR_s00167p00076730 [Amborella trichopoda]
MSILSFSLLVLPRVHLPHSLFLKQTRTLTVVHPTLPRIHRRALLPYRRADFLLSPAVLSHIAEQSSYTAKHAHMLPRPSTRQCVISPTAVRDNSRALTTVMRDNSRAR